ncbi:esterase/lipase family protein [Anaeromyxobacter sp. SG26]|uniref:esterase/lipase family protein n=1 Tax=Anaeromyxobacter sp. SG26 TaxID=2925407 RepID=UPI001F56A6CD|nr:GPI inositol-deacylase [Anaeromyxobacter sp. SG26]
MPPRERSPKAPRSPILDLRGASRLVIEATNRIADVVEAMHHGIGAGPAVLGRPLERPVQLLTRPVYGSVRGVTRLVGDGIDAALARLEPLAAPLLGERPPGLGREAVVAALNGVLGDYLAASGNPLAIEMRLRSDGRPLELHPDALRLAFPRATGKLLVLVHGSCVNDRQWTRRGHDHGAALARDLGFTPIYLHYNSGLHVSVNGRAFAGLLEQLVAAWPTPVDDLVLLAHSMGGLVARSACHFGEAEGHAWRRKLRALVCLGTPHHGAPLERGGHWIDLLLGVSRYSAPLARLGKLRSAGVTDMRHGNVLDAHWEGRDRFAHGRDDRVPLPLPQGARCYAIAGSAAVQGAARKRPTDGLVPVDSALGVHERPELTLGFPEAHRWIAHGTKHLDLLSRPEVYAKLRSWLSS